MRFLKTALVFFSLPFILGQLGCPGQMDSSETTKTTPNKTKKDRGVRKDQGTMLYDLNVFRGDSVSISPDAAGFMDSLFVSDTSNTIKAGDPCVNGGCGSGTNLLCMQGICLRTCKRLTPDCQQQVEPCAENEICEAATSLSDACFPANKKLGDDCPDNKDICPANTMCIGHNGQAFKCMQLCPDKVCPQGLSCSFITSSGCYYCATK